MVVVIKQNEQLKQFLGEEVKVLELHQDDLYLNKRNPKKTAREVINQTFKVVSFQGVTKKIIFGFKPLSGDLFGKEYIYLIAGGELKIKIQK